ncbi:c-type cytochrome [Thiolapillus sp.]
MMKAQIYFLSFLVVLSSPILLGEERVIPEYDRYNGEEIMDVCAGCHGIYGQGTLDGEYPRLAGMNPAYIARQIELFKTRKRINIAMLPFATDHELPGDDVRDISSYLAGIELPRHMSVLDPNEKFDPLARLEESKKVTNIPHYPGDVEKGERLYRQECRSCHGLKGEGRWDKMAPMLTGQYSSYLLRQIEKIRTGDRFHDSPDDPEIFRSYSDEDIANILAWLSRQDD